MASDRLPQEIYNDIFLRLPVKSTFVCKCVCKNWCSIISNPGFDKLHLHRTLQTKKHHHVMIESDDSLADFDDIHLFFSVSCDSVSDELVELDFPYPGDIDMLGSCNGIVYGWNFKLEFFFLWNPATTEYKRLPLPKSEYKRLPKSNGCGYHGLGYDSTTDDYKLVDVRADEKRTLVRVYSLKSDKWRSFEPVKYGLHCVEDSGVVLNGAFHWFQTETDSPVMIVSMDLSEEKFELLELPAILPTQQCTSIGVLQECLCVLASGNEALEGDDEIFDVWVMEGYGDPDSWTKLYSISITSYSSCYVKLLGSLNSDEILFVNASHIILYGSRSGTVTKIGMNKLTGGGAFRYVESLVSLNSGTFMGTRENRKITRILKKSTSKKGNKSTSKKRNRSAQA